MMKAIVRYYELAQRIIADSRKGDGINFAFLKSQTGAQLNRLKLMKFQDPRADEKQLAEFFSNLVEEITTAFENLVK